MMMTTFTLWILQLLECMHSLQSMVRVQSSREPEIALNDKPWISSMPFLTVFFLIAEFDKRWHNEDPPGNFEDHNAISIWKNEPAWYDPTKFSHID
jgi:hypothetical protein